ncbi:MAG: OPT family oligopeptide transporter [Christensenellaceae bacterium]|jgi:putative OPT family oligopeptide transporter
MEEKGTFKPFIPADKVMPELTVFSIVLGVILAVVFGAANAYLGLRVGQTISASIPAAVISMGLVRGIFKRDSILENNMVQTIGSAGEAVAAGSIFTLPVFFLWFSEWGKGMPSYLMITLIAMAGGILGIVFMVPLRRALIVNEHETLPYPEGTACVEVLRAGETGGSKAKTTFLGVAMGAGFKFFSDGFKLFPSSLQWSPPGFKGLGVGLDILPALTGVGYIIGPRIAAFMFSGGLLGWLCIMPLISYFGSLSPEIVYPGLVPIADMGANELWSNYLRYVGSGAVAFGGIFGLFTSLPMIVKSFGASARTLKKGARSSNVERTDQDISLRVLGMIVAAVLIVLVVVPAVPINLFGALLILVFGFFFSSVASRIVGLVGSSSSPVSGMTIATLLITTLIFIAIGQTGQDAMIAIMCIASVVCIIAAIAGDTSQDLKTGYLLGATPKKQQWGEMIGVVAAALTIGGVLILFNSAWGFGSSELPAVQATLMKMIVEGVMLGDLPWVLVLAGAAIGLVLAILRLPVLAVAIGLYLPISLTSAIMVGGLLRLIVERVLERKGENGVLLNRERVEGGVLYSSGLIAGEGLMGILLAVFTVSGVALTPVAEGTIFGPGLSIAAFALLGFTVLKSSLWRKRA